MNWKWEELTAHDFPAAVFAAQETCVLPIGVLEKHGEHLPIGTDLLSSRVIAERAIEIEPAILFPWYYFGQIHEAKQWPGAVTLPRDLLCQVLESVLDEIARNGLKKIILLNGHGGNEGFLEFFTMLLLEHPRPYTVYTVRLRDYMFPVITSPEWKARMQSAFDYHAGEMESSLMLGIRPDLVKMQDVPAPGDAQQRLGPLAGMARTTMFWYADYPDHYAGDASAATVEKGEFLLQAMAARTAEIIGAVKADQVTPALEAEYFSRIQHGKAKQ